MVLINCISNCSNLIGQNLNVINLNNFTELEKLNNSSYDNNDFAIEFTNFIQKLENLLNIWMIYHKISSILLDFQNFKNTTFLCNLTNEFYEHIRFSLSLINEHLKDRLKIVYSLKEEFVSYFQFEFILSTDIDALKLNINKLKCLLFLSEKMMYVIDFISQVKTKLNFFISQDDDNELSNLYNQLKSFRMVWRNSFDLHIEVIPLLEEYTSSYSRIYELLECWQVDVEDCEQEDTNIAENVYVLRMISSQLDDENEILGNFIETADVLQNKLNNKNIQENDYWYNIYQNNNYKNNDSVPKEKIYLHSYSENENLENNVINLENNVNLKDDILNAICDSTNKGNKELENHQIVNGAGNYEYENVLNGCSQITDNNDNSSANSKNNTINDNLHNNMNTSNVGNFAILDEAISLEKRWKNLKLLIADKLKFYDGKHVDLRNNLLERVENCFNLLNDADLRISFLMGNSHINQNSDIIDISANPMILKQQLYEIKMIEEVHSSVFASIEVLKDLSEYVEDLSDDLLEKLDQLGDQLESSKLVLLKKSLIIGNLLKTADVFFGKYFQILEKLNFLKNNDTLKKESITIKKSLEMILLNDRGPNSDLPKINIQNEYVYNQSFDQSDINNDFIDNKNCNSNLFISNTNQKIIEKSVGNELSDLSEPYKLITCIKSKTELLKCSKSIKRCHKISDNFSHEKSNESIKNLKKTTSKDRHFLNKASIDSKIIDNKNNFYIKHNIKEIINKTSNIGDKSNNSIFANNITSDTKNTNDLTTMRFSINANTNAINEKESIKDKHMNFKTIDIIVNELIFNCNSENNNFMNFLKEIEKCKIQFEDCLKINGNELISLAGVSGQQEVDSCKKDFEYLINDLEEKIKIKQEEVATNKSKLIEYLDLYKVLVTGLPNLEKNILSSNAIAGSTRAIRIQIEEFKVTRLEINKFQSMIKSLSIFCEDSNLLSYIENIWDRILTLANQRLADLHLALLQLGEIDSALDDVIGYFQELESELGQHLNPPDESISKQLDKLESILSDLLNHRFLVEKLGLTIDAISQRSNANNQASFISNNNSQSTLVAKKLEMDDLYKVVLDLTRSKIKELKLRLNEVSGYKKNVSFLIKWFSRKKSEYLRVRQLGATVETAEINYSTFLNSCNNLEVKYCNARVLLLSGDDMLARCHANDKRLLSNHLALLNDVTRQLKTRVDNIKLCIENHLERVTMFHEDLNYELNLLRVYSTNLKHFEKLPCMPHVAHKILIKLQSMRNNLSQRLSKVQKLNMDGTRLKYFGSFRDGSVVANRLSTLRMDYKCVTQKLAELIKRFQKEYLEHDRFDNLLKKLSDWLKDSNFKLSVISFTSQEKADFDVLKKIIQELPIQRNLIKKLRKHFESIKRNHQFFLNKIIETGNLVIIETNLVSKQQKENFSSPLQPFNFNPKQSNSLNSESDKVKVQNQNNFDKPQKHIGIVDDSYAKDFRENMFVKEDLVSQQPFDLLAEVGDAVFLEFLDDLNSEWNLLNINLLCRSKCHDQLSNININDIQKLSTDNWPDFFKNYLDRIMLTGDLSTVENLIQEHQEMHNNLIQRIDYLKTSDTADKTLNSLIILVPISERRFKDLDDALKLAMEYETCFKELCAEIEASMKQLKEIKVIKKNELLLKQQIEKHMIFSNKLVHCEQLFEKFFYLHEELLIGCIENNSFSILEHRSLIAKILWKQLNRRSSIKRDMLNASLEQIQNTDLKIAEIILWLETIELKLTNQIEVFEFKFANQDKDKLNLDDLYSEHMALHNEILEKGEQIESMQLFLNVDDVINQDIGSQNKKIDSLCEVKSKTHNVIENRSFNKHKGADVSMEGKLKFGDGKDIKEGLQKSNKNEEKVPEISGINLFASNDKSNRNLIESNFTGSNKGHEIRGRWSALWKESLDWKKFLLQKMQEENQNLIHIDDWLKKFGAYLSLRRLKAHDVFKSINMKGKGDKVRRQDFVDAVLNTKFSTNKPEIAIIFDLLSPSQSISLKELLNIITCRKLKITTRFLSDVQLIKVEIRQQLLQCKCNLPFNANRIGPDTYKFGDRICMVRCVDKCVVVRVGGGWISLNQLIANLDPCRAKNRPSMINSSSSEPASPAESSVSVQSEPPKSNTNVYMMSSKRYSIDNFRDKLK